MQRRLLANGLLHGSERYAQNASYHRGVTERAISFVHEEPMPVNTGLMS
jgi:hypothetical protein